MAAHLLIGLSCPRADLPMSLDLNERKARRAAAYVTDTRNRTPGLTAKGLCQVRVLGGTGSGGMERPARDVFCSQ